MTEKFNYHLASFFSEFIQLISQEVAKSLSERLALHKPNECSQPLLTTDELASSLNVSKSHINKLRKKHQDFPVINLDGSVRFRQSEVEHFFKRLS